MKSPPQLEKNAYRNNRNGLPSSYIYDMQKSMKENKNKYY